MGDDDGLPVKYNALRPGREGIYESNTTFDTWQFDALGNRNESMIDRASSACSSTVFSRARPTHYSRRWSSIHTLTNGTHIGLHRQSKRISKPKRLRSNRLKNIERCGIGRSGSNGGIASKKGDDVVMCGAY